MIQLKTAEELIRETTGQDGDGESQCTSCGRTTPMWALYVDESIETARCGHCLTNDAINAPAVPNEGWDGEKGNDIRAERNQRIAAAQWAVLPGSPLSTECQAAFLEYIKALHRLTIDFDAPASVVWPDEPALDFGE
ncbi:phage tail assembly chaperone [Qipengyuania citrea]|uniref:phage tail assembly chaperone n=1 Tax=Qipengyuania citrea TaxID=225971 RepID=UPI001E2ECB2E|nr:phage tail assembly chaperone [Qipengyuania citrea]MCD1591818.1 phage tail assembly chaperone [Qipengyuania citrea]